MGAEQQYVVFRLMGQPYGAAIDVVREVNHLTQITRLPNTPAYVEGVIDLRGEVLPVVDLRKRLGLPAKEADGETRLMVLSLGEQSAALIVDGVEQVLTINTDEIVPPNQHVTLPGQDYVVGVARGHESLVVVLDLARLMRE
ncbi:MAG: cheW1 [Symbiobacteriaceae bacterium]|jgi:purine-binding chemotaxis protein CheW|nr:cheW1 [Symbiobacteriaceae bacterium]